jgi:hypothetical protein
VVRQKSSTVRSYSTEHTEIDKQHTVVVIQNKNDHSV